MALPDPNSKQGRTECGKKIKHDTLEEAYLHADDLTEEKDLPNRAQKYLVVYHCRLCDKWHVGHKGKVNKLRLNEWHFYLKLREEREHNGTSPESLKQESALCQTPQAAEKENGQIAETYGPPTIEDCY